MKIDYSALEAIKQLNLAEIAKGYGLTLKETHRGSYSMLCPFHDDKNPSLYISLKNGKWVWNCFGCHKGGNVLEFVIQYEKISFAEAYQKLALMTAGGCNDSKPPTESPKPGGDIETAFTRQDVLQRIADYYHQTFLEDQRGAQYLATRGIHGEEIYKGFKVGYASGKLRQTLPSQETELVKLLKLMGILNEKGNELFYGCVVFPIYDENGNVSGMYGRKALSLNPQEAAASSPVHLYLPGPHKGVWNMPALKLNREIVLTESIIDALSCYQMDVKNAVPLYGVNGLTSDHERYFKEYRTQKAYLCFDNDDAGRSGRVRIKEKLSSWGIEYADIYLPEEHKDINEALQKGFTRDAWTTLTLHPADAATPGHSAGSLFSGEEYPKTERKEDAVYISFRERRYRIRGLEGKNLEKMRVNIKVETGESYHLDTLDLYSSKSRSTFCGQCRKIMEAEEGELMHELNRIIYELEKIQSSFVDGVAVQENAVPVMSEAEKEEALNQLKRPELLNDILADLEKMGYVGEASNKAIGYLVAVSRKLEDPLSCVIISQSSAGKSALADVIEKLVPPEECLLYSRITPQALYYMDKGALKRKLLMIEESVGADNADYSIRTLQSKKKLTQAVPVKDPNTGRIRTMSFEVEGPIAYIETTTRPRINQENATRCFELYLDESKEQTRRIQDAQKESKTIGGLRKKQEREEIVRKHQNMQRLLREVKVVTPFAHLLDFPTEWLRTRRDNLRFLNLIEAITFLHQYQRPLRGGDDIGVEYIESTMEDYTTAYLLAREVLGESFTELKKPQRDLLHQIEKLSQKNQDLSRREIREYTGLPDYRLRDLLTELVSLEYLQIIEGRQGKSYQYRLDERVTIPGKIVEGLTHPDELARKIGNSAELAV